MFDLANVFGQRSGALSLARGLYEGGVDFESTHPHDGSGRSINRPSDGCMSSTPRHAAKILPRDGSLMVLNQLALDPVSSEERVTQQSLFPFIENIRVVETRGGVSMSYDWAWGIVPRTLPALFEGLRVTLAITVMVIILGFLLGILVAAGRLARNPLINKPVAAYVEFFRSTPALVQLVWMYYCLPIVLGIAIPSFASIVIALSLNVGAFYGEAIRSGIQAIPRDQVEAADILGLSYPDKMRFVVLPQAFRIIIPVALSLSISLFKETSLVSTLGMADLMYQARVVATETYRPIEILTVAALIYFIIAFPFTVALRVVELRLARVRR